jgi:hypothetical protein
MNKHLKALTIEQADELILESATKNTNRDDSAIEDAEETDTMVTYFFESGAIGKVNRLTAAVEIDRSQVGR